MLKTHTGVRIQADDFWWFCGKWRELRVGVDARRPGRARQMRRMVAKAKRRQRREFLARANARPVKVSAARMEVRCGGQVIGYASDFLVTLNLSALPNVREVNSIKPMEFDVIPPGDYSAPFVLPEGAMLPGSVDESELACGLCDGSGIIWDMDADDHEIAEPCVCASGDKVAAQESAFIRDQSVFREWPKDDEP